MKVNIIGDIAGNFDALQRLLAIMPEADLVIGAGDLVDRGPKSREVVDYFMNNDKAVALLGNHELMMLMACRHDKFWGYHSWVRNGGQTTIDSYKGHASDLQDHLDYIETMPLFFHVAGDDDKEGLLVTHAPQSAPPSHDSLREEYVWNRYPPKPMKNHFLVHGHNWVEETYTADGKAYGMCIDGSSKGELIGLHWPTKEVYRVKI